MTSPRRRSPATPRMRGASPWLSGLVIAGAAVLGAPIALAAPAGEDDWTLERRDSDARIVSQRLAKLRARPFDSKQWRALLRAIGPKKLASKIDAMRRSRPRDVALRILDARAQLELGAPAIAAVRLEQVLPDAGRWEGRVFALRVDALEAAGDLGAAMAALDRRAQDRRGAKRIRLLERAHRLAERAHLHDDALRLARALDRESPSLESTLRLARAARRANDPELADRTYARAVAASKGSRRTDLIAERAGARLAGDSPSGAAALLWSLLEHPDTGGTSRRERWWRTLGDAHRRDGSTEVLAARLSRWLSTPGHAKEAAAWRALAVAQEAGGGDPVPAWKEAVALDPRNAELRAALIEALEAKGETEEAVALFRSVEPRSAAEVQNGLELANRLIANGNREVGMNVAHGIEAGAGRSAHTLLLLLDFYNLNDEPTRALTVARRLVRAHPRNAEARVALGEQLYQMGQTDEALEQWKELPTLVRPKHLGWARLAEILNEHGRRGAAWNAVRKALQLAPEEPRYLRLMAVLEEDGRRADKALKYWQEVLERADPKEHKVMRDEARTRIVELLVGGVRSQRERMDEAVKRAKRALERGRPLAEAVEGGLFLAELHTRRERYRDAVAVHQTLLALQPDDPERLAALATAQRRAGLTHEAMATLERLLQVDPSGRADILADLSELAFEAGDTDGALAAAGRAAHERGNPTRALVRLGQLQERKGNLDDARRAYQQALAISPTDARARLQLAELHLLEGDANASARIFREVLVRGGPPELMREAGRRALDLAEATSSTAELFALAVERSRRRPDAAEPREFLLASLDRTTADGVEHWLRADGAARDPARVATLRRPLVAALARGSVGARLRAAEHLGRLKLPDTAVPLARMGAQLTAPRDATRTVREAFEHARAAALEAAGELDDREAVPVFATLLDATDRTSTTRRAAAWALARSTSPDSLTPLLPYIADNDDPLLQSVACLALSAHPQAALDEDSRRALAKAAYDSRSADVLRVCRFAMAALTPDHRVDRLLRELQASDPLVAAIAAWRLGLVARDRVDGAVIEALLRRYLGPHGLPRDAAAAALARLLSPGSASDEAGKLPPPVQGGGWATALRRWLQDKVAPRHTPIDAAALEPHLEQVASALAANGRGTRAERASSSAVRRECTAGEPAGRDLAEGELCLSPLVRGTLRLPANR